MKNLEDLAQGGIQVNGRTDQLADLGKGLQLQGEDIADAGVGDRMRV